MSCEELNVEMAKAKQEMTLKLTKIKERETRNRELSSLWFLIYPLAERDNLKAEEIEMNALNSRYNNLFMIAAQKGCALGNNTITIKKTGGRDVTINDVLVDELPSSVESAAALRQ